MVRAAPPRPMPSARLRFAASEDGSLTVFALCLFVLMVIMAGVAIDVTRYESTRTALQNTLDRCTLMAAAMDQRLPPEQVVRDCVSKAGMTDQLQSIEVVSGMNFREVKSQGRAMSKSMFMHMIGIEKMDALAVSAAVQSISNIELALVLDVSGSMAGAKIDRLKVAASNFVDTVLAADHDNRMSIALVPYNGQVNLGASLRSQFNATDLHGVANVNCLDLPASVYTGTAMSQTLAMPMTGDVDTYSSTSKPVDTRTNTYTYLARTDSYAVPGGANKWCPPSTTNTVRMPSNNGTTLKAQINALTAIGATSINAGLKWGLTLLDPASRAAMTGTGQMSANFNGRPFAYTDPKATKIIVLMTDGEHFMEERLNAGYRTEISPIRRSIGDGEYSILHASRPGANKYWVPHRSAWQATAWNSGSGFVQLNWNEVWAAQRMSYVAWQMYGRALGTNTTTMNAAYDAAMTAFRTKTPTSAMDTQLQQVCSMAKNQSVIIYGIAFEAPVGGQAQILQCASSPEYYYNANGPEIESAFNAIANNITQLRLTQ